MIVDGIDCNHSIAVVGYPRSGQHGISNWIVSQFDGLNIFLNSWSKHARPKLWYLNGRIVGLQKPKNMKVNLACFGLEGRVNRRCLKYVPRVIVVRDIKNHLASPHKHKRLGIKPFLIFGNSTCLMRCATETLLMSQTWLLTFQSGMLI